MHATDDDGPTLSRPHPKTLRNLGTRDSDTGELVSTTSDAPAPLREDLILPAETAVDVTLKVIGDGARTILEPGAFELSPEGEEIAKLLHECPLFHGIAEDRIAQIAHAIDQSFLDGTMSPGGAGLLINADARRAQGGHNGLYIALQDSTQLTLSAEGTRTPFSHTLNRGEAIGELAWVGIQPTASVVAKNPEALFLFLSTELFTSLTLPTQNRILENVLTSLGYLEKMNDTNALLTALASGALPAISRPTGQPSRINQWLLTQRPTTSGETKSILGRLEEQQRRRKDQGLGPTHTKGQSVNVRKGLVGLVVEGTIHAVSSGQSLGQINDRELFGERTGVTGAPPTAQLVVASDTANVTYIPLHPKDPERYNEELLALAKSLAFKIRRAGQYMARLEQD